MMVLKITICLLIFFLMSDSEMTQLCLSYFKTMCYSCNNVNIDNNYCIEITTDMKLIHFDYNLTIDYQSYINTNIKMIEEPGIVTYYPCWNPIGYFQVNSYTYYPIERIPGFPVKSSLADGFRTRRNHFQKCLETFCLKFKDNSLKCLNPLIDSLDFEFNAIVHVNCIQNVTYAYIDSDRLLRIRRNYFFHQAFNLVHLKLNFKNLTSIKCDSMQYLRNLKEVIINILNFTNRINPMCIFRKNPYLVKVTINNQNFWNPCKVNSIVNDTSKPVKEIKFKIKDENQSEFKNFDSEVQVFLLIVLLTGIFSGAITGYLYFRSKRSHIITEIQF